MRNKGKHKYQLTDLAQYFSVEWGEKRELLNAHLLLRTNHVYAFFSHILGRKYVCLITSIGFKPFATFNKWLVCTSLKAKHILP